ncbi:MAG: hypothetical protein QM756_02775 [Polyangiaceae bacterium]
MTYDLYFVPYDAGSEPSAVQAFLEQESEEGHEAAAAPNERVAAALLALNAGLERFEFDYAEIARLQETSVEEAQRQNTHIELNTASNNGIQTTLFSNQASITVPYWYVGEKAEAVFAEIASYAKVLTEQGPYRVYDPQLDRVIDDFDEIRAAALERYCYIVRRMPRVVRGALNNKKPWWQFW